MTATTKKPKSKKVAAKNLKPKKVSASATKHAGKSQRRTDTEQPMMKTLRAEHRHMANVLNLLSKQLDSLEADEYVDSHVVYEIMDYITSWPDQYHHPREDIIYGRVAEISADAADEVDTLQGDHDATAKRGKALLALITGWRNQEVDVDMVVKKSRDYICHVFEHMELEEKLVFPHIEAQLTLEDWRELEQEDSLQAVSAPIFGPIVRREYRNLSRRLRRSVRRKVEETALAEWVDFESLMETVEVLSMAVETARDSTGSHVQKAARESWDIFVASPVKAPVKCALNNARVTFEFVGDIAQISAETLDDLQSVRLSRKERLKLLAEVAQRR